MTERFYQLLPSIYRQHDAAAGEPLRALLAVLERELRTVEADVEATYDNWFVQTCDAWVLPYLADLVGIRTMGQQRHIFGTQRRMVANTIAYRRRKGTLGALEHALRDVTGWHVRAVEMYQQLAATPHLGAPGRRSAATADLRDALALDHAGGPFNQVAHSANVRAIRPAERTRAQAGRYNLGNLALFVWRLRAYTIRDALPYLLSGAPTAPRRFALHPTGRPTQLFNQPQVPSDTAGRLTARNLPLALHRAELAADLDEYAASYADRRPEDRPVSSRFYGPDSGLQIALLWPGGSAEPLLPLEVACVDLAAASEPTLDLLRQRGKRAAIDPVLGQVALLASGDRRAAVRATYTYGFSAEIGGGPYNRGVAQSPATQPTFLSAVARGTATPTLREALAAWNEHCGAVSEPHGVIRVLDNARHGDDGLEDLVAWLPVGASLTIAADNGVRPAVGPSCDLVVQYERPVAARTLTMESDSQIVPALPDAAADIHARRLLIDGLLLDGRLRVESGTSHAPISGWADVQIQHSSIIGGVELGLSAKHAQLTALAIRSSIVGPLRAPAALAGITVSDSIIDGAPERADKAPAICEPGGVGASGPALTLERATIFGDILARRLAARDSLIAGTVPSGQPPDPTSSVVPSTSAPALFTSTLYGQPGYAQLRFDCPAAYRRSASNGSQPGVFTRLYQDQAEDNLAPVLDEFAPVGLECGFVFIT